MLDVMSPEDYAQYVYFVEGAWRFIDEEGALSQGYKTREEARRAFDDYVGELNEERDD